MDSRSQILQRKKWQIFMPNSLQNICRLFQISRFVCNIAKVNVQVELFKEKSRKICRHHQCISSPPKHQTSQSKAGGYTGNLPMEVGAVDKMEINLWTLINRDKLWQALKSVWILNIHTTDSLYIYLTL